MGKGGTGPLSCMGTMSGTGAKSGECRNAWSGVSSCRCTGFISCKWETGCGGNGNGGGPIPKGPGAREAGGGPSSRWMASGGCIGGDTSENSGLKGGSRCIKGPVGSGRGGLLFKASYSCFR